MACYISVAWLENEELETNHRHPPIGLYLVSGRVEQAERHGRPIHQRKRLYEPRKQEIVDHLGALAINLAIHFMNECAILLRKVDPSIVRGRTNPNLFAMKLLRTMPDAQMMTRVEGVILLLKHYVGRPAIQE